MFRVGQQFSAVVCEVKPLRGLNLSHLMLSSSCFALHNTLVPFSTLSPFCWAQDTFYFFCHTVYQPDVGFGTGADESEREVCNYMSISRSIKLTYKLCFSLVITIKSIWCAEPWRTFTEWKLQLFYSWLCVLFNRNYMYGERTNRESATKLAERHEKTDTAKLFLARLAVRFFLPQRAGGERDEEKKKKTFNNHNHSALSQIYLFFARRSLHLAHRHRLVHGGCSFIVLYITFVAIACSKSSTAERREKHRNFFTLFRTKSMLLQRYWGEVVIISCVIDVQDSACARSQSLLSWSRWNWDDFQSSIIICSSSHLSREWFPSIGRKKK